MAPTSPSNPPPPTRRPRLCAQLRVPALLRRGTLIIVATLFSRPLGYVRVAIQAWLFGATAVMDAFMLAFSVPSMLQVVLLTGPLSGVLVPTLTAYRHDRQALNKLFNSLFTLCLLAGVMVASLAAWGVPLLMRLAGPGLAPETHTCCLALPAHAPHAGLTSAAVGL